MLEDITPDSVAAEVHLLREDEDFKGVFLFVEGETDFALFSNFVDGEKCQIRRLRGKENVLTLIEDLIEYGDTLCLAIVDADFWHIEKRMPPNEHVVITDTHDIETLIFKSPALEKVFSEYISVDNIEKIRKRYPDIRTSILSVARYMAIIKWVNHIHDLRLYFYADSYRTQPIEWATSIDIETFKVNGDALLNIICNDDYSKKKTLARLLTPYLNNHYDPYKLCNGHDVLYVTLLFLKRRGRKIDVEDISVKNLERLFRLSYEVAYFKQTMLYQSIMKWQQSRSLSILKI